MSQKNNKIVKSKTVLTAPNLKRLGAFLLDYVLLYLIYALIVSLVNSSIDLVNVGRGIQIALYAFLIGVAFLYHVIQPIYLFKGERIGQTPGKKVLGLKIITANGEAVDLKTLSVRFLAALLLEGFVVFATLYLFQIFALLGMPVEWTNYITPAYLTVTFASGILMVIKPSRQMIHDYVANTVVILANQSER